MTYDLQANQEFKSFLSFIETFRLQQQADQQTVANNTFTIQNKRKNNMATFKQINVETELKDGTVIIDNFIEMMENQNATTTMGTIQYIDRLSKYNLANVWCDTVETVETNKTTPNNYLDIMDK